MDDPWKSGKTSKTLYKRNESSIRKAVFLLNSKRHGRITAKRIAKATGLTRQAIYNHYSNMEQILPKTEEAVLADFTAELDLQMEKLRAIIPDTNTRLFYVAFVFIAKRRELFAPICADIKNHGVIYRMGEILFPRLEIMWLPKGLPSPTLGSERTSMLIHVLVEIISQWSLSTKSDIRKARRFIKRLLRAISDAAANRLP